MHYANYSNNTWQNNSALQRKYFFILKFQCPRKEPEKKPNKFIAFTN